MDRELQKMQEQINSFCSVKLQKIPPQRPKSFSEEELLILGLALILAVDGADMLTVLMLMYIYL